ncbi:CHAT domain-containing protein [Streptomyces alboniger]|uniref:CHAT domain-containing protein n=2 Tax=Streptomyces alboniger TaxID=132473 RepID=A0A5J6HS81_STRAD|nr:CHAT domain-containing protein [Streptomyces alboniger]
MLLSVSRWTQQDYADAVRTHDELEEPGAEMSTVEARELRKRLRTPPASMLEAGLISGARRAVFAGGHLDRPSGPARRMYSLAYLALVRFDQALTGNRQCLDAAIILWRTCLEAWEAAGETERSAFAGEIHSVDCSLAGALGTRYNLNREFLVHPDPPLRPDDVRADLEEAFRAIERGTARLPSHRDGSDPQLQVFRQQLQAVKAYLVSLKYADMPAGPGSGSGSGSGSEMSAIVAELDLIPYAPPGDTTGARSTWLGTRMFLAQALSGPGARISDLRRAEKVLLGFLEAPDLTEESLIAAAQLSLATARMLLADSTGDERYRPLAQDAFEQSYLTGARSNLRTAWDAATQQAGWARRDGHRLVAARAYAAAFRVLPVLTHTQITRADKESALAMAADTLPMCARELANSSAPEDRIEAVLALEGARGVLLAEGLGQLAGPAADRATSRPSSTAEGDARTAQAIAYLTRELDGLRRQELTHPAGTAWRGAARMAACQRQLALVHARSRDGSDEPASPDWQEIVTLAGDAPLVYLTVSRDGGAALVVTGEECRWTGPVPVDLPTLTVDVAGKLLDKLHEAEVLRDRQKSPKYGRTRGQLTRDVVNDLWAQVMQPIANVLADCERAVLLPGGLLGMLPLHAAGTCASKRVDKWRFLLETTALSYAPHAAALRSAARGRQAITRLTFVHPAPTPAHGASQPPLNVAAELSGVRSAHPPGVTMTEIESEEVSRARLLDALRTTDVLHFTGHGDVDSGNPLGSGLHLGGDARLKVRDLLAAHEVRAMFAVLSACGTAVTGDALPDEVVGLPAALIQAGLRGIVATQWTCFDDFTAPLMREFYRCWLSGTHPSVALARAQATVLRQGLLVNPFAWATFAYTGA